MGASKGPELSKGETHTGRLAAPSLGNGVTSADARHALQSAAIDHRSFDLSSGVSAQPTTAVSVQLAFEHATRQRSRAVAWCLERRSSLVVWSSILVWSVALSAIARADYLGFRLGRLDLGNMTQAVWNTAHGRLLENTNATGEQASRLAMHVDPILALLAPLWIVAPTPLTLATVQVVACALGALPVFWLGRRYLESEATAACVAVTYLCYPWLASTAVDAMHPVTLAIPLLLFGIWFLESDRLLAFAPFAIAAALTGELMGLTVAALGIWYALGRGHRVPGFTIALLGVGWSAFAVKVIIPMYLGGPSVYYSRYSDVGGSPEGVAQTALTHPDSIFAELSTRDDLGYWLWLSAPLLGIFVMTPGLAAVAVPQLLANGLSGWPLMSEPETHYVAGVVPFLIAASVIALSRFAPRSQLRVAIALMTASAIFLVLAGPVPTSFARRGFVAWTSAPPEHLRALRTAVSLVPENAPVASTNNVGANLSARRYVYTIDVLGRADWVVLDTGSPGMERRNSHNATMKNVREVGKRLERSASWRAVFNEDGVLVFRRVRTQPRS